MFQADPSAAATHLTGIADTIRLAVAPVFLLTGVAAVLGVLTNRLARIVDRARADEQSLETASEPDRARLYAELEVLSRRSRVVNLAISLTTLCALLVCSVIVLLFLGALLVIDVSAAVAILFIGAMVTFIAALLAFLREVYLATASLRFGQR